MNVDAGDTDEVDEDEVAVMDDAWGVRGKVSVVYGKGVRVGSGGMAYIEKGRKE